MPTYDDSEEEEEMPPLQYAAGLSNLESLDQHIREDIKGRIQNVEKEIQTLRQEQARIQLKIDKKAEELLNLRIAVAPHKRLPTEILTRIFHLTLENDHGQYQLEIPIPPLYAPWALRQVCSSWRQIILDFHPMWSAIRVCSGGKSNTFTYGVLQRRYGFVNRILSKQGPISLSVYPADITSDCTGDYLGDVTLFLVWKYLTRIEDLDLVGNPYGHSELFETTQDSFQSIKRLRIGCFCLRDEWGHILEGETRDLERLRQPRFFETATSLQELRFSGDQSFWNQFKYLIPKVPWHQLFHLTLDANVKNYPSILKYSWITRVLLECENLTSLEITFTEKEANTEDPNNSTHITLPKLQSLIITIVDARPLISLTLPALEHLNIISQCAVPVLDLISLVMRSSCSLKSCTLEESFGSPHESKGKSGGNDDIFPLYELLPHLERLDTFTVTTTGKFHLPMLERLASGNLLPSLINLSCRTSASPDDFVRILSARFGGIDRSMSPFVGLRRVQAEIDPCFKECENDDSDDGSDEWNEEEYSDDEDEDEDEDEEGEPTVVPICPKLVQELLEAYGTYVNLTWGSQ